MTNKSARPSPIAPLGGVVVGIAVFLGVNITIGRAVIPTRESVVSKSHGLSKPVYATNVSAVPAGPVGPYQTVCATCHQPEGQGMPGAFPPLAGSEWMTGNPEVPIRIALLGLTGPVEVKGAAYNSTMPPPPGMNDEQLAEAITYARTHFGNTASKVDVEQVKRVRAALAGRTEPFKADELKPLLAAGAAPQAVPETAPQAAPEGSAPAAAEEPAPVEPPAQRAPVKKKKPGAAKKPAPTAAPAAPAAP